MNNATVELDFDRLVDCLRRDWQSKDADIDKIVKTMTEGFFERDLTKLLFQAFGYTDHLPFFVFAFLIDNAEYLQDNGIFEEAITNAYTMTEAIEDQDLVHNLFARHADIDKLKKLSDQHDHTFPTTLYRGVKNTRANGISWTGRIEVAAWFAQRNIYVEGTPRIYKVHAQEDRVLYYTNGRKEDEFLLDTDGAIICDMGLTGSEIRDLARRSGIQCA